MSTDERTQWYIGAPNGVVLCVNSARGEELAGLMFHSYSLEPIPFDNIEQMTQRMEQLYDWLNFPRRSERKRSFSPDEQAQGNIQERKRIMSDETLLRKHGDLGTFIVRVQHRQNSSWQGRITWMEQDKTIQFRSVWEMIKLMESAVNSVQDEDEEETEQASWF